MCYDHLTGRLGVAIAHRLTQDRAVIIDAESGWVTDDGGGSL
jgi:hypothetical protein